MKPLSERFTVTAVVVPHVTCDLPQRSISLHPEWNYLHGLRMADPHFGNPSKIYVLLGVDIFVAALLPG